MRDRNATLAGYYGAGAAAGAGAASVAAARRSGRSLRCAQEPPRARAAGAASGAGAGAAARRRSSSRLGRGRRSRSRSRRRRSRDVAHGLLADILHGAGAGRGTRGRRRARQCTSRAPAPALQDEPPISRPARPAPAVRMSSRSYSSSVRFKPRCAAGFCKIPHAKDIALPLRNGDHAARIKKIEDM